VEPGGISMDKNSMQCQEKLSRFGKIVSLFYHKTGRTQYPSHYLLLYYLNREEGAFRCPDDESESKDGKALYTSYEFNLNQIARLVAEGAPDDEIIVAYDKANYHGNGRNVLFLDGHIEWVSEESGKWNLIPRM